MRWSWTWCALPLLAAACRLPWDLGGEAAPQYPADRTKPPGALVAEGVSSFAWAPDGRSFYLTSAGWRGISTVALAGGAARVLDSLGLGNGMILGPDGLGGSRLYYTRQAGDSAGLHFQLVGLPVGVDTPQVLLENIGLAWPRPVAVSGDGTAIALWGTDTSSALVTRVWGLSGTLGATAAGRGLALSRDGRRLLFLDWSTVCSLLLLDVQAGSSSAPDFGPAPFCPLTARWDGDTAVVVGVAAAHVSATRGDTLALWRPGAAPRRFYVVPYTEYPEIAAWSADGRRLAIWFWEPRPSCGLCDSDFPQHKALYVVDLETGTALPLAGEDMYGSPTGTAFSSDGASIAYVYHNALRLVVLP